MPPRRNDRRPAPRPPLKPTLNIAVGAIDDFTRALAAALVDRYSPACAWEWACAIDVNPGCVATAPATFTLRFKRHDSGRWPDIRDDYELTWREMFGEPVADVNRYAGVILEHAAELRRNAVLDYANDWRLDHPSQPSFGPSQL
jgi:hypothetical protein